MILVPHGQPCDCGGEETETIVLMQVTTLIMREWKHVRRGERRGVI